MKVLDALIAALKKIDAIFTMLENTLKWHWKIIILLSFCGLVYWAFTLPPISNDDDRKINESADTATYSEYYEENGDTLIYKNGTN